MKRIIVLILGLFTSVVALSQTYCTAGSTTPTQSPQILNVTFDGVNNSSAVSPCLAYTYYSALSGTVAPGGTLTYNVTTRNACSSTQNKRLSIFVDWNIDGDFADAGETILTTATFTVNNFTTGATIPVPPSAVIGNTRLRVVLQESTAVPPSCGTFAWGEVEDYNLSIFCPAVNGLSSARQFDICNDQAEDFTFSGTTAGKTLTWQTSPNGLTWTNASTVSPFSVAPITQTTFYRLLADNGSCSAQVGSVFRKIYFNVTSSPDSVCPGGSSQLNASALPVNGSFTNTTDMAIPDNGDNTPVFSPITVSNVIPTVINGSTVNRVCMNITHPATDDLDIDLVAPDGTTFQLAYDKAGTNYTNTCFVTGSATAVPTTGAHTGTYRPDAGDLGTAFIGKNTNGTWRLKIVDDLRPIVGPGPGTLLDWTITFNEPTIQWSPATGLSSTTIVNPIASNVNSTITYTATVSFPGNTSCQLVQSKEVAVKPSFIATVTGTSSTICEGNSTTLTATATQVGCSFSWYTAASGGTLLNSTNTYSPSPTTTTTYFAEATFNGCPGTRTAFTVTVIPTPATPTGSDVEVCSGQSPTLSPSTITVGATIEWYTAATGGTYLGQGSPFSPPAITTTTTYYAQATKSGCTSPNPRLAITATVNPLPVAPSVVDQSVCSGSTATFTATAPAGTYNWYSASTGGSTLATAASFTTPTLSNGTQTNTNQSYWVTVTDAKGCVNTPRQQINVTIKSIPLAPTVTTPVYTCEGTSITVTATAPTVSDQLDWWDAASAGTNLFTGNSFTTTVLNADAVYYVSTLRNGCYNTTRTIQDVKVVVRPVITAIADKAICSGSSVLQAIVLTPSANMDLSWSSVPDPGITGSSATGTTSPINDVLSNTGASAIVEYTINASSKANVPAGAPACAALSVVKFKVTVNPLPAQPTVLDQTICNGTTGTFTATAPSGTFNWYAGPATVPVLATASTFSANPSSSTSYYVAVTDVNNCVSSPRKMVTLTVNPIPAAPTIANQTVCSDSTASLLVTSTGDAFNWFTNSSGGVSIYTGSTYQTPTISALTTYYVETTTLNCTGPRRTVTVTPIATPTLNPISGATVCSNSNINKILSGNHASGVNYSWTSNVASGSATGQTNNPNSTTASISDIITNTGGVPSDVQYTVRSLSKTTPSCPSLPQTFTITVNPEYLVTAQQTNVVCFGLSTGSLLADGSAATQPATYTWKKGTAVVGSSASLPNLNAGTYELTVADAGNCKVIRSYTITQPAQDINIASALTQVTCKGDLSGAIDVTVTNAVGAIGYNWSNSSTVEDQTALAAGAYSLEVTDGNGCKKSNSFTITEPATVLSYTATQTDVLCFGNSTGAITINVAGGTKFTPSNTYNYLWSNGATGKTINTLAAGNYSVTVTDKNNCTLTASFIITQPAAPVSLTSNVTNVNCFGASTGAIDVTPAGGTTPYTFVWTGIASTNEDISGVIAKTYGITITDKNACKLQQNFTITQLPAVTGSLVAKTFGGNVNVSCFGSSNGELDLTPAGGTAPYTFNWTPTNQTSEDLTNLAIGNHSVVITDANGCKGSANKTLTGPTLLTGTATAPTYIGGLEISCFGKTDGSINFTASGGVQPYSYLMNANPVSYPASGLGAGTYALAVVDANACQFSVSKTLNAPANLVNNSTLSSFTGGFNIQCNGLSNGSIQLSPAGGTSPYTYVWNTGETTSLRSGLAAGNYNVVTTDANGCNASNPYTLTQPAAINLSLTPAVYAGGVNIKCFGDLTGSITSSTSGGQSPYTYLWNNGVTNANISGLSAGMYNMTVTDRNGCQKTTSTSLSEPVALAGTVTTSSYSGFENRCNGDNSGSIQFTPNGGTAPYTYLWNTSQTTSSINNLIAGTYILTTTDANGCKLPTNITLNQPPALASTSTLSNFNGFAVSCFGLTDGAITVVPNGGVGLKTITWSGGLPSNYTQTGLSAGSYNYIITDANGCQELKPLVINQPNQLNLQVNQTAIIPCFGNTTGKLDATLNGGVTPYTYAWTNSQSIQVSSAANAAGLGAGTYNLTVTDNNGCQKTISNYNVSEPSLLVASISSVNPKCFGSLDGQVNGAATGGTTPYNFKWTSGPAAALWSSIGAGLKTLTITDQNGCVVSMAKTLTEPAKLQVNTIASQLTSCDGKNTGSIQVSGAGGTLPYTYSWSNSSTQSTISNLTPGSYQLTITDQNLCSTGQTYMVNNILTPDPSFSFTDPLCGDLTTGIIAAEATGFDNFQVIVGTGNFSTNDDISYSLQTSNYGVIVLKRNMNNAGCKSSFTDTISFKDIPEASFGFTTEEEISVLNNEVTFKNTSNLSNLTNVTYDWTLNGVSVSTDLAPKLFLPNGEAGVSNVCVEITNGFGCSDKFCMPVVVVGKTVIYVPNSFSPDFDGINEEFSISTQGIVVSDFHISIYNRSGQVVFSSSDPYFTWNGKSKTTDLQEGVYIYEIRYRSLDSPEYLSKSGTLNIFR